jgi:hypothetical protein
MKEVICNEVEKFAIQLLAEKIQTSQQALQALQQQGQNLIKEIVKAHGEDSSLTWNLMDSGKIAASVAEKNEPVE